MKIAVEYLNRFEIYFLTTGHADRPIRAGGQSPRLQDDVRQFSCAHRRERPGKSDCVVRGRNDSRARFRE